MESTADGKGKSERENLYFNANVHTDILGPRTLADHLTGIHLVARRNEKPPPILQLADGIGIGRAALRRDQRTVRPPLDLAPIRFEAFEPMRHHRFATLIQLLLIYRTPPPRFNPELLA